MMMGVKVYKHFFTLSEFYAVISLIWNSVPFLFTVVDSVFGEWRQIYTQKRNQKYLSKNILESSSLEPFLFSECAVTSCVAELFDAFHTQIFRGR